MTNRCHLSWIWMPGCRTLQNLCTCNKEQYLYTRTSYIYSCVCTYIYIYIFSSHVSAWDFQTSRGRHQILFNFLLMRCCIWGWVSSSWPLISSGFLIVSPTKAGWAHQVQNCRYENPQHSDHHEAGVVIGGRRLWARHFLVAF